MKSITDRRFGVEIEFVIPKHYGSSENFIAQLNEKLSADGSTVQVNYESYNHNNGGAWKYVTDGSVLALDNTQWIGGNEIVSPPLRGFEGLADLRMVLECLEEMGCDVNKTTGLHVHHDFNDATAGTFKSLYKLYCMNEALIDQMMPESRRGNNNEFCRTISRVYGSYNSAEAVDHRFYSITSFRKYAEHRVGSGARYCKLNFLSYWRHGTIEFRHHSGSIDAVKIINWIIFTQAMVEKAMKTRHRNMIGQVATIEEVVAYTMSDNIYLKPISEYCRARINKFN